MRFRQSKNRRRAARVPAEMLVRVYRQGQHVGEYRSRDVSQQGLGLRPGRVMFLEGSLLEVELLSPRHRRLITERLPAVVRYCRGRGMGLKLRAAQIFLS